MLLQDYTKRLSAPMAFSLYTSFLKNNYPDILSKIENKIILEYPGTIMSNGNSCFKKDNVNNNSSSITLNPNQMDIEPKSTLPVIPT